GGGADNILMGSMQSDAVGLFKNTTLSHSTIVEKNYRIPKKPTRQDPLIDGAASSAHPDAAVAQYILLLLLNCFLYFFRTEDRSDLHTELTFGVSICLVATRENLYCHIFGVLETSLRLL
ncbi:hypothetical protein ACJX0J_038082, partial [Zea mays]